MYPKLDNKVLYYKGLTYYKVWLDDKYIDCSFLPMVLYILSCPSEFTNYYNTASTFRKLENNFR